MRGHPPGNGGTENNPPSLMQSLPPPYFHRGGGGPRQKRETRSAGRSNLMPQAWVPACAGTGETGAVRSSEEPKPLRFPERPHSLRFPEGPKSLHFPEGPEALSGTSRRVKLLRRLRMDARASSGERRNGDHPPLPRRCSSTSRLARIVRAFGWSGPNSRSTISTALRR